MNGELLVGVLEVVVENIFHIAKFRCGGVTYGGVNWEAPLFGLLQAVPGATKPFEKSAIVSGSKEKNRL